MGTPLPFSETNNYVEHVHSRGLTQLINSFKTNFNRDNDKFYWGDETEYTLVNFDNEQKRATLDLEHDYVLKNLGDGKGFEQRCKPNNVSYHPEYGRFMVEATPLKPYDGDKLADFLDVEKNMEIRKKIIVDEIKDVDGEAYNEKHNVVPLAVTSFPTMGVKGFTYKDYEVKGEASHSLFLPDEIINRHVRFPTLTKNIRTRRGQKVALNVPIFPDTNTQSLSKIDVNIPKRNLFFEDNDPFLGAAKPGHIYMDSMGFGMGCSCLQVTMQAANIDESRYLYDTLLPLTPILLSLSAAAPIFKGTLADQDVRWNVISGAVDDRTPIERGVEALKGHKDIGGVSENRRGELQKIRKSRYDSIDQYLGDFNNSSKKYNYFDESYNDLSTEINDKVYERLSKEASGHFDENLARHFAHLFIRDPLVLFSERAKPQDDEYDDDHFQNIQSTNWQTLRFKPPAAYLGEASEINKTPGWRVEFRPLEIQITDFENAAFAVFVILAAKSILKFKPNFYLPISLIDDNMGTAHKRNSLLQDKFWFREKAVFKDHAKESNGFASENHVNGVANGHSTNGHVKANGNGHAIKSTEWSQLTIDEIINGNNQFVGIAPLVKKYLATEEEFTKDPEQTEKLKLYIKLIEKRASGEIPTLATYIRKFVTSHPNYKQDSIVGHDISYDLLSKLRDVGNVKDKDAILELFGKEIGTYLLNRYSN